jgi:hypothetical protein
MLLEGLVLFKNPVASGIQLANSRLLAYYLNQLRYHVPHYPKLVLRGLQSASELYRLSDRHLSTKFSANFCG